jgi:hypothetical protein
VVPEGPTRPRRRSAVDEDVERLYSELLRAGESLPALREVLAPGEPTLVAVLRRAVPQRLLQHLSSAEPWSSHSLVLAAVATNPRVERTLALRLVPQLPWRALASICTIPWVSGAVKNRAEATLRERLTEMRLGERISLARLATQPLLLPLLQDSDARVAESALQNPRLREEDVLYALGRGEPTSGLIQAVGGSSRWRGIYGVRLALVLQPATPLSLGLAQISRLLDRDLLRVVGAAQLRPLLRAAARRVLVERGKASPESEQ